MHEDYRIAGNFVGIGSLAVRLASTTLDSPKFLTHIHTCICMVIPYQTAKFKSTNFFATAICAQPPSIIPAKITGYAVLRSRFSA